MMMPITAIIGSKTWKMVTMAGSTLVRVALAIATSAAGMITAATKRPMATPTILPVRPSPERSFFNHFLKDITFVIVGQLYKHYLKRTNEHS